MIKAQRTGLLWFLKEDLEPNQIERLKVSHTYVNPKDQENTFSTFIELKDKFGVPYGDLNKVQLTLGETDITDKRIQPKFKTKKKSKLQLRDYQESVMVEIEKFLAEGGTAFNLSGEPGCLDKDTEFLTLTGWKKISEYTKEDFVAEYLEDGTIQFKEPLAYINKPCDEWYDFFSGSKLVTTASKEHTMIYKTSKHNLAKKSAGQCFLDKSKMNLITNFKGNNLKGLNLTTYEIQLAVAISADAHVIPSTGRFRFNLKKQNKIARLEWLLIICNIDYKKFIRPNGYTQFYFYCTFLNKGLHYLWGANTEQLQVISEEVQLWDGSKNKFFTTIKEEADFVQYVFSSQGVTSNISIMDRRGQEYKTGGKTYIRKSIEYEVHKSKDVSIALNFKSLQRRRDSIVKRLAEPNDRKYCFTTSTGMFLIRKNGKITVTGNSGKSFMLANILTKLGTKTLIIAHLSQLTRQLAKEIEEVLGYKPTVLDKDTKELGDINIATSQLISKNPDLWYLIKKGIGCIVIDEAETLASLSTLRIVQRAHAKYHIFISATFTRSVDHRTEALMDFAGNNVFTLKNPALLKPQVIAVHCPEVFNAPLNQNLYNSARGRFYKRETIADKVLKVTQASLKKNRQVLIACDIVELQNTLKDRLEVLGIKAECINSSTKVQRRTDAMVEFNEGKLQVLIGFGTLNAGLSIPKISTIIRVATPNSKEKLEQLIGRARRDFDGKDGAFVIDLMFQGFNNESRLSLYKKKRRTDDWKLSQCTWEAFEDKIKGR